jgi:tRNA threonylcarbamoyladenosine biosynthesis protein TsaB
MLILAFDTTSEHGGAALFRDLDCLACAASERAGTYSITLFQMVDKLLKEAGAKAIPGVSLRDIELYAVANGPGSFTGIRVGLAAAQAWAKAFDRPVRGVSVLEAMVDEARPETDLAIPILDARRGEFYLGSFRRGGGQSGNGFLPEGDGQVLKPQALAPFLEECLCSGATLTCLVRACDALAQNLRHGLPKSLRWAEVPATLLHSIARLGLEAYRAGRLHSFAVLDACYIRRSDAEMNWRE